MYKFKCIIKLILCFLVVSCTVPQTKLAPEQALGDSFLWLEEIEGSKSLDFVKNENQKTFSAIKSDPHYKQLEIDIRKIALADDRMPWAYQLGSSLFNFWQDKKNVRGVWRKTSYKSYVSKNPVWENVLDLDQLSMIENENWVWKGSHCLPPEYERCLLSLSRGGKDAKVIREFDLTTKTFVKNGFYIPEAKNNARWIDLDTIYLGSDFGPNSLTDSGYPRIVKVLKRGQRLDEAKEVFQGEKKDLSTKAYVEFTPQKNYHFLMRNLSFYESQIWYANKKPILIPMPKDAIFQGVHQDYIIYILRSDLQVKNKTYKSGSIVALPIKKMSESLDSLNFLELIFTPSDKRFVSTLSTTRNHILLDVIDNIKGKIATVTKTSSQQWEIKDIPIGQNGVASIASSNNETDIFLADYTDFLTPPSLFLGDANRQSKMKLLKKAPSRFNEKELISEQYFTKSKDGTIIPYFIVHKKSWKKDGSNPTLLVGYGGFEVSLQPYYLNTIGKVWAERGGVYVVANTRGGGEFGSNWHKSVIKENRQKVFEDFIAVAEDLIKQKITSPAHLGIQGGSNGGLLVASTFIQRPDLFNAVVCEVPLLDMLRYQKLLAGASWMDEYGDPEDPKMRKVIEKYSPYQNILAQKSYPEVFFLTSTKDDRVHPGHARKMVAKMRSMNHPLFYFENTEGGHGGAANIEQRILWNSLEFTYLWRKLGTASLPGDSLR